MYALKLAPHDVPATTQPVPAPREPRATVRRYERQDFTGADAYVASILATRLTGERSERDPVSGFAYSTGGRFPWDLIRCAAMLSQRGIRAALGDDIARRLDWLLALDQRRERLDRAAARKASRAARRAHVDVMGGMCTSFERTYLGRWPETHSTHHGAGTTSQQWRTGYLGQHGGVMSADEAEAAFRPLLVGEWIRVQAGWSSGQCGSPPFGEWIPGHQDPIPAGILLLKQSGMDPAWIACGSSYVLVPMDAAAHDQFANLRQLAAVRAEVYSATIPTRGEAIRVACPRLTP